MELNSEQDRTVRFERGKHPAAGAAGPRRAPMQLPWEWQELVPHQHRGVAAPRGGDGRSCQCFNSLLLEETSLSLFTAIC